MQPLDFYHRALGFHPDPTQAAVLSLSAPRRVLLNCTRQWGKSTVTAALAVHRACHRPASLTLVLSPSLRQSGEWLRKASRFLTQAGIRFRRDPVHPLSLTLPNHSRIVGLPDVESTVRGFSAPTLVLIDEASRVSDDLYYAVRPMLATSDGDLWLCSTPAGRRGFFHDAWQDAHEPWHRLSVPAADCPRISADFLATERQALGPDLFRQEYACAFLDTYTPFPTGLPEDPALSYLDL